MVPDDPDGRPAQAGLPSPVAPAGSGLVRGVCDVVGLYWLQTLGCPKNQVDSDKLEGYLAAQGYEPRRDADDGRPRRRQHLRLHRGGPPGVDRHRPELADRRRPGARLVVTGCMAERYGDELRDALPEVDLVAGFGAELTDRLGDPSRAVPVTAHVGPTRRRTAPPSTNGFDLLELPRPAARAPWAYVKVAEGCDRICGFCAIPSFRGKQRSRSPDDVLAEVDALCAAPPTGAPPLREIVLVAQDLASYGRDRSGPGRRTPHRQRPLAHRRARPAPCRPRSSAPGCSTSIPPA